MTHKKEHKSSTAEQSKKPLERTSDTGIRQGKSVQHRPTSTCDKNGDIPLLCFIKLSHTK